MKPLKFTAIACLQLLLLTSCLTTRQTNLLQQSGGDITTYPRVDDRGEYIIKPGDELIVQITVAMDNVKTRYLFNLFTGYSSNYSDDNKLNTFSVSPEGDIYFPYIGSLYVAGKTTHDIQTELETKINRDFLKGESCLVYVGLSNRYFSVIGESSAGRYPIAKEKLTIYQALSQSKDIRPYGDRSQVKIIRRTLSGTVIKTFDLRSAGIVNSEFYYIQPNDVIYIQPLGRQFWGMNSFGAVFAFISTLSSLGVLVYNLAKK
jgi:polysaccharide export outer membrane protein